MDPVVVHAASTPSPFALLVAACAAGMAAYHARCILLGRAALRWPTVQGTVLDAYFDESSWRGEDGDEGTTWSAHLCYRYSVKGIHYRSCRFTWRPVRGIGQHQAYALLQGLRRGSDVEVRYDPGRPGRAVVIPGIDAGNWLRLLAWVLGAGVALVWAYSG